MRARLINSSQFIAPRPGRSEKRSKRTTSRRSVLASNRHGNADPVVDGGRLAAAPLQGVWHAGDDRARPEEERRLDAQGGLVVQDLLPPVAGDELGQDDRQRVVRTVP